MNCDNPNCQNLMWVEEYNKVQIWMVEHQLWEKYKMGTKVDEVVSHLKNINGAYGALNQIKRNIENLEAGEYSYDRAFNNILELTNVALEYIRKEL